FQEVILGCDHNQMLILHGKADITERQANNIFQRRNALFVKAYQRFIAVGLSKSIGNLLLAYAGLQAAGNRRQNAAREIAQMRSKNNLRAEMGSNFRLVPMIKDTVRLQANFAEAVSYC